MSFSVPEAGPLDGVGDAVASNRRAHDSLMTVRVGTVTAGTKDPANVPGPIASAQAAKERALVDAGLIKPEADRFIRTAASPQWVGGFDQKLAAKRTT